jgi:small subunit ribosomal protein S16
MGRKHRPYYRIVAIDARQPRDGRIIEELGSYDPMVRDTNARYKLNLERYDYWTSVGAQPSEHVVVLARKYRKKVQQPSAAGSETPPAPAAPTA